MKSRQCKLLNISRTRKHSIRRCYCFSVACNGTAALRRYDSIATPTANVRYLRIAAVHRYEFERQERVGKRNSIQTETSREKCARHFSLLALRRASATARGASSTLRS
jgi:hypothetical protein